MPKAKRKNPTKPLSMSALTAHVEKANAEHDHKVKFTIAREFNEVIYRFRDVHRLLEEKS
jgi:hypothetical protein